MHAVSVSVSRHADMAACATRQLDDSSSKRQGWHEVYVRGDRRLRTVDDAGPRTRKTLTLEGTHVRTCGAGGREESESL